MRLLSFVAAGLLTALGPATAGSGASDTGSEIRNPSAPLASLHAEALVPLLSQMGLDYEGATLPGGQRVLLVIAEDGARFQITPMACDGPERCRGLHLLALFEGAGAEPRTVAAFNQRYAFVTAGTSRDGVAYLSRYELADFGMPRGNFGRIVTAFLSSAALFEEHLEEGARGLRQGPEAGDLAAYELNMKSLARAAAMGMAEMPEELHPHTMSFEETSRIVETFVRAERVYPGRVVNPLD